MWYLYVVGVLPAAVDVCTHSGELARLSEATMQSGVSPENILNKTAMHFTKRINDNCTLDLYSTFMTVHHYIIYHAIQGGVFPPSSQPISKKCGVYLERDIYYFLDGLVQWDLCIILNGTPQQPQKGV